MATAFSPCKPQALDATAGADGSRRERVLCRRRSGRRDCHTALGRRLPATLTAIDLATLGADAQTGAPATFCSRRVCLLGNCTGSDALNSKVLASTNVLKLEPCGNVGRRSHRRSVGRSQPARGSSRCRWLPRRNGGVSAPPLTKRYPDLCQQQFEARDSLSDGWSWSWNRRSRSLCRLWAVRSHNPATAAALTLFC